MSKVCKFCVMESGLKGSELKERSFSTDEELFNHIEENHDLPVRRPHETEEECLKRFKAKNKRAGGFGCRCPSCRSQKENNIPGYQ